MLNSCPKKRGNSWKRVGPSGRNWEFGIEHLSDLTNVFPRLLITIFNHFQSSSELLLLFRDSSEQGSLCSFCLHSPSRPLQSGINRHHAPSRRLGGRNGPPLCPRRMPSYTGAIAIMRGVSRVLFR